MDEKITVAVAVYNAEKYLKKAVNSIIDQDYQNLDILLIDDGSTDNSGYICDEFARVDSRVRVLHQKNGGLCAARNAAIENMLGNYIMFVDNDDWVENNIVSFLYDKLIKNNLDMAACTSIDHFEDSDKIVKVVRGNDKILNNHEAIKDFYFNRMYTFDAIQCKLYKKEIFTSLRFKVGRRTDDTLTTPQIFDKCARIGYFNEGLYNYLVRKNSMCRAKYDQKSIDKVLAYTDNWQMIKDKYPESLKLLEHNIYGAAATNYLILKVTKEENKYLDDFKFYKKLMKEYKPIFSTKRLFVIIFYFLDQIPFMTDILCVAFNKTIAKATGALQ